MKKLMSLLGYTVEAFPSAAISWRRPPPETACLVTDVQMPGMTGVELHRHLNDAGHAIPTILVTAYPDEVVRDRALKNGVFCYLCKPVDDDHLERCLRSAVQWGGRLKRTHEVSAPAGTVNRNIAPRGPLASHPQPTPMCIDDGPAHCQPHC